MNINDRVKVLRKYLKLSQKDFGARVDMSQGHLTNVETGKRELIDKNIKLICMVFNVDENWLRTGQGNMFISTGNDLIEKLTNEYHLNDAEQKIVASFCRMDEEKRHFVAESFFAFIDSMK